MVVYFLFILISCGIKARCYWEHPWGTHWELSGNKGKMKKSLSSPRPKTLKNKIKAL
jgi:hypothetical protein